MQKHEFLKLKLRLLELKLRFLRLCGRWFGVVWGGLGWGDGPKVGDHTFCSCFCIAIVFALQLFCVLQFLLALLRFLKLRRRWIGVVWGGLGWGDGPKVGDRPFCSCVSLPFLALHFAFPLQLFLHCSCLFTLLRLLKLRGKWIGVVWGGFGWGDGPKVGDHPFCMLFALQLVALQVCLHCSLFRIAVICALQFVSASREVV